MTLDTLLSVALDVVFLAVFALTFVDWLRHRGKVRRAVVLVFASTAIVLGAPALRMVFPGLGPILGAAAGAIVFNDFLIGAGSTITDRLKSEDSDDAGGVIIERETTTARSRRSGRPRPWPGSPPRRTPGCSR